MDPAGSVRRSGLAFGRRRLLPWLLVVAVLAAGGAALTFEPAARGLAAIGWERGRDRTVAFPIGAAPADPEGANLQVAPDGRVPPGRLAVVDSRDHDPFGSGEEHRADVRNVSDGDPSTIWQTERYRGSAAFGGLKPGVGVWLDVGDVQEVTEVAVSLTRAGASFDLYVGAAPPAPGVAPADWGRLVAEVEDAGTVARWTFDEPTAGRVWLVWFRRLPPDGERFRASVSEVILLSS